ncbi:MAG: hypothetical protein ACFCD0_21405 [Gemmataceae bacterium]
MTTEEFVAELMTIAKKVNPHKYKQSRRKPKKKVEKINDGTPHKSTAKILAARRKED